MKQETFDKALDIKNKLDNLNNVDQRIDSLKKIMIIYDSFHDFQKQEIASTIFLFYEKSNILHPLWEKFLEDSRMIIAAEIAATERAIEQL